MSTKNTKIKKNVPAEPTERVCLQVSAAAACSLSQAGWVASCDISKPELYVTLADGTELVLRVEKR